MSWDIIRKPKDMGGLDVSDLVIKNAALLFKCWLRFFDGGDTLWKKVVCSNHREPQLNSVGTQNARNNNSVWNQILDFSSLGNMIMETSQNGLRKKVGCGNSTRFWLDVWLDGGSLNHLFLRKFAVSTQ